MDEAHFEDGGLQRGAAHDVAHPLGFSKHVADLATLIAGEVGTHAFTQVGGLPDIQNFIPGSGEEVDAGGAGQVVGELKLGDLRVIAELGQGDEIVEAHHTQGGGAANEQMEQVGGGEGIVEGAVAGLVIEPEAGCEGAQLDVGNLVPHQAASERASIDGTIREPGIASPLQCQVEVAEVVAHVVAYQHGAGRELDQGWQHRLDTWSLDHHRLGNAGEHGDGGRNEEPGVDHGLERTEALAATNFDGTDLSDAAVLCAAAGGLDVNDAERDVAERRTQVIKRALHSGFTVNERTFDSKNKCSSVRLGWMNDDHVALRPALELAFLVAAVGSRQHPPLAVPAALRPFVRHQKMPGAARQSVYDAVTNDVDFRLRVLSVADEATVGPAGMVWLTRAANWESALASLAEHTPAGVKEDPKLVRAQRALRDAKAALVGVKTELALARRQLHEAEVAATKAERTRAGMEGEIAGLRSKLEHSEADRASLLRELRELTDIIDRNEQERDDRDVGPWDAVFIPDPDTVDFARLSADLTAAEEANMAFAEALTVVRRSLYRPENAAPARTAPVVQLVPPLASVKKSSKSPRRKRHRLRLPGGVRVATIEEAKFLVSSVAAIVVIDGYNVAKLAFPRASLVQQREQLLDLTDEMQARFGTHMIVVFDGADVGPTRAPRRRVSVQFSPAGVTADDMIVSWLTAEPLDQAVVVVTSDNAVREACDLLGAQLIHSAAFLAAAGRVGERFGPKTD